METVIEKITERNKRYASQCVHNDALEMAAALVQQERRLTDQTVLICDAYLETQDWLGKPNELKPSWAYIFIKLGFLAGLKDLTDNEEIFKVGCTSFAFVAFDLVGYTRAINKSRHLLAQFPRVDFSEKLAYEPDQLPLILCEMAGGFSFERVSAPQRGLRAVET